MRTINTHPQWENHPLRLSDDEKQNLQGVLEDFFSCFHLQDIREILWDWLVAALSSDSGAYNTGYSRSNLVFVYEKLELLIEAAYGICKQNKRKKRWKRRKWKPSE